MRRGWTLVVVGAVVLAGCEAPTRPEHRTRINRIEMSGALAATGVVEMKAVITYPSDDGGTVRLAAPTLGTVSNVRIDGSPRTSSGEGVDIDVQGAHPTLEWSVAGAAERYVDGAIVTLPLWTP